MQSGYLYYLLTLFLRRLARGFQELGFTEPSEPRAVSRPLRVTASQAHITAADCPAVSRVEICGAAEREREIYDNPRKAVEHRRHRETRRDTRTHTRTLPIGVRCLQFPR